MAHMSRKAARAATQTFLRGYIPNLARTDAIWQEWIQKEHYGYSALTGLLYEHVRTEFKMRAIAVLLTPHFGFLPFRWNRASGNFITDGVGLNLTRLSKPLQQFTVQMALRYIGLAEATSPTQEVPSYYGPVIRELLGVLPENSDTAEKLFAFYQLKNPTADADTWQYEPFYSLLFDRDVPEGWKQKAILEMERLIRVEVTASSRPQTRMKSPRYCYERTVANKVDGSLSRNAYSVALFAQQVEFLVGLPLDPSSYVLNGSYIGSICRALSSTPADTRLYQSLRHRLFRRVVLETKGGLQQLETHGTTGSAIETIIAELRENERLLKPLVRLVRNESRKIQRERARRQEEAVRQQKLLRRMR